MNFGSKFAMTLVGAAISASMCSADTLPTHRIPAALAIEAATETIAACARQGYRETAVVLDADGATIDAIEIESTHTIEIDRFVPHSASYPASDRLRDDSPAPSPGRRSKVHLLAC